MSENQRYQDAADRIYHEWDAALASNDVDKLLSLYTSDAVIESPLIPHLMNKETGICRGKGEIRTFIELVAQRKPNMRKYYRTPFLKHNNLIMWEYPRSTPEGEQMDFIEVMELAENGLIQYQRVYWGWRGNKVLSDNAYHRL